MISAYNKFAMFILLLIGLTSQQCVGAKYYYNPCRVAFRQCNFRFQTYADIPTVSLSPPYDRAVSPRIISKKHGETIGYVNYTILGVLNSNNIPAEVVNRKNHFPITYLSSNPPLTPIHVKPFPIRYTSGSGIGFQTLTGTQKAALRKRCIRLFFTEYQVLNKDGTVKDNINNVPRYKNKCVVFRTH